MGELFCFYESAYFNYLNKIIQFRMAFFAQNINVLGNVSFILIIDNNKYSVQYYNNKHACIQGRNLTTFARGPLDPKAAVSWGPSKICGAPVLYIVYNIRDNRGAFRAPSSENLGARAEIVGPRAPGSFHPCVYVTITRNICKSC